MDAMGSPYLLGAGFTIPASPGIRLATATAATAISAVQSMSFQLIRLALLGLIE